MDNLRIFFIFGCTVGAIINNAQARLSAESIIAGDQSEPHEFPYQIALMKNGKQICGGGIINEQFVLTAAHCLIDDDNYFVGIKCTVITGINDLNEESNTRVEVGVEKAYVPTLYDGRSPQLFGDIAVLKLKEKLNLGSDFGLAKLNLPPNTTHHLDDSNSFVHLDAMVAGFGFDNVQTNFDDIVYDEDLEVTGSSSGKLTKLKVKTISKEDCEKGIDQPIKDTRMCVMIAERKEGVPRGFCYGDSGSPLVHNNVVIGVVSISDVNCDDTKAPAVFTRVSAFIDLIENAMKDNVTNTMRSRTYY